MAFYTCSRMFGKKWGPKPATIHWMYIAIVRPILTYGCLVWWPAAAKATNLNTLTRIQRLACIGTTSAIRTTPTAALETMLGLCPLDLFTKEVAAKSALRLRETRTWKNSQIGHSTITKWINANEPSDYMATHLDFNLNIDSKFPLQGKLDKW